MKQQGELFFIISLVIIDLSMAGLAFFFAYHLRLQSEYENIQPFTVYFVILLIHGLIMATTFFFYRLYHQGRSLSVLDQFYAIFGASSVGSLVVIAISTVLLKNILDYPRLMMIYAWLLTVIFTTIGRALHGRLQIRLQAYGWGEEQLLIVGASETGRMVLQKILRTPGLGYNVAGFVDDELQVDEVQGTPVLGRINQLPELIEAHNIGEVIIAMPEATHQQLLKIISRCDRGKVAIKVFPDVFQIMASEVSIGELGGLPLLTVRDLALRGWRLSLKRVVDVFGSLCALIIFSPAMMLVAMLVKLDSDGPVFYSQERMGLDGKQFFMIKFRSMRPDAEAKSGAVWTSENDDRRTPLGTFLRRYSIDELPQFVNVLLGEMSLVGPRPERPVFVEQFKQRIPRYMDRHKEKAGLTGWAQVNGLRGNTSITERTKYDLWYIENWSLALDFRIMLRTAISIFNDRNAY